MTQCVATSKRTGERCGAKAMRGRNHCYHHGGRTPVGPAAPSWKHGRRSKYLPQRLIDDYLAMQDDPEQLALSDEITLIDSRINDVLTRVDSGESGKLWSELRETVREFEVAQRSKDTAGVVVATNHLLDLVKRGNSDWAAWSSITDLIERRRKLVDSERKRLVDAQQMIAVDQAMALMAQLVYAVREVGDERTLSAITTAYVRIIGSPAVVTDHDVDDGIIEADTHPIGARNGR